MTVMLTGSLVSLKLILFFIIILIDYCCGDLKCIDNRCQAFEPKIRLSYEGQKVGEGCDPFHYCGKDLTCEGHRCVSNTVIEARKLTKDLANKLTGK